MDFAFALGAIVGAILAGRGGPRGGGQRMVANAPRPQVQLHIPKAPPR